jgi:hypothetical protein
MLCVSRVVFSIDVRIGEIQMLFSLEYTGQMN